MCMLLGCISHWLVQAGVARALLVDRSHTLQSASLHHEQCPLAWNLDILIILYTCMTTGMEKMEKNTCVRRFSIQARMSRDMRHVLHADLQMTHCKFIGCTDSKLFLLFACRAGQAHQGHGDSDHNSFPSSLHDQGEAGEGFKAEVDHDSRCGI